MKKTLGDIKEISKLAYRRSEEGLSLAMQSSHDAFSGYAVDVVLTNLILLKIACHEFKRMKII